MKKGMKSSSRKPGTMDVSPLFIPHQMYIHFLLPIHIFALSVMDLFEVYLICFFYIFPIFLENA